MAKTNRIIGERIYFRQLTLKDASKEYCSWLNDPVVNKYLETRQATIADLKKYITEKNKSRNCLFLGIFDKKNNRHIGNIKLEPIDYKKKKTTFSIIIGNKRYWGKGIGTEATSLLVDYAFQKLGMNTVDLGVISMNKPAIRVYEKVGFKITKILKKKMKHGDKHYDKVVMEVRHKLKFLVLGCGSIGKRHIKNLIGLDYKDIIACDTDKQNLDYVRKEYGVEISTSFDEALERVDAVLICTPNHLHTQFALKTLKAKKHVFMEKPISDKLEGLKEIRKILIKKNLVFQAGYNLRYHPLLLKTKKLLEKNKIGKIYNAYLEYGSYLPNWRPGQDYTKNYGAHKSMGGGIILDDIHEINYATWFFGKIKQVFCSASKISDLKINTEDNANIILKSKQGFNIVIHMDYLQLKPSRKFKIIGSKGLIEGDINCNRLLLFDGKRMYKHQEGFDYNQTYIDEIEEFISCINTSNKPIVGFEEALYDLKIALAIKKSVTENKVVLL